MEICCPGWQSALLKAPSSVGKKFQEPQVRQKCDNIPTQQDTVIILVHNSYVFCTLKLTWHDISVSLTGSMSTSTNDAPQGQPEKEDKQEESAPRAGRSNKKSS